MKRDLILGTSCHGVAGLMVLRVATALALAASVSLSFVPSSAAQIPDSLPDVEVSFAKGIYYAFEGGDAASVKVELSESPQRAVTVAVNVERRGGAAAADYSLSQSVTFAATQTHKTVTVTATENSDKASDTKSLYLTFGAMSAGVTGDIYADEALVVLIDDEADDCAGDTTTTCVLTPGGATLTEIGALPATEDVDYFAFEAEDGSGYLVILGGGNHLHGVYDSYGGLLGGTRRVYDWVSWNGYEADTTIRDNDANYQAFSVSASGTHYIWAGMPSWVRSQGGYWDPEYTIALVKLADDFESNSTTTGVVNVGASADGVIDFDADVDWFLVDVEPGKTYDVSVTEHTTSSLRPELVGVYDVEGTLLPGTSDRPASEIDYDFDTATARFTVPDAVASTLSYHIAVTGYLFTEGSYRVSVAEHTPSEEEEETETEEPPDSPMDFTASFDSVAASHDGSTPFQVQVSFSEEPSDFQFTSNVLEIDGGSMTLATQTTAGSNASWTVTVTPSAARNLTITVPKRDCEESDAICVDDRPLEASVNTTVPYKPPLAARMTPNAERHDGSTPFQIEVKFSVEPSDFQFTSNVLEIDGGSMTDASSTSVGSKESWIVTVAPSGERSVSIRVPKRACEVPGAVCVDGRQLEDPVNTTVAYEPPVQQQDPPVQQAPPGAVGGSQGPPARIDRGASSPGGGSQGGVVDELADEIVGKLGVRDPALLDQRQYEIFFASDFEQS